MADTRKKFGRGIGLTGFKPGQVPYMVGPDKTIKGITTHITLDGFDGTNDKKVRSFHISFKGIAPQPVAKWAYNGSTNTFDFKGWVHFDKLGLEMNDVSTFKTAVSKMAKAGALLMGAGLGCQNAS